MNKETLFSKHSNNLPPLANRMRPNSIENFVGQEHIIGEDQIINQMIKSQKLFSIIFWGPPGSGKTTLARIITKSTKSEFYEISAVTASVKDVRKIIKLGENNLSIGNKTILFIDEIHRFSKNQQDALLHAVEDGTIILIGATTENPSFEVISPLLSRCRVLKINPISNSNLKQLLTKTFSEDILISKYKIKIDEKDIDYLINSAGGDARKMYNTFEIAFNISSANISKNKTITIERKIINTALQNKTLLYDKDGDYHYDTISAFIKSVRGSDPDAAIYWLAVMLEGGEDPIFIARRLIILSSEDIGNADPQALVIATNGFQAVKFIGMPEAAIVLAQVTTFLSTAPKSNASYVAVKTAQQFVKESGSQTVPLHLRNAPTKLMKEQNYGIGYKYPHSYHGFTEQEYFPKNKPKQTLYLPKNIGYEKYIKERLSKLWPSRYD